MPNTSEQGGCKIWSKELLTFDLFMPFVGSKRMIFHYLFMNASPRGHCVKVYCAFTPTQDVLLKKATLLPSDIVRKHITQPLSIQTYSGLQRKIGKF